MLQTLQPQAEEFTANPDQADITTRRIRELNDTFRKGWRDISAPMGRKMMTAGIRALGPVACAAIAENVMAFEDFTHENDPHNEHDFGAFDYDGEKIFWKIDYYSRDLKGGSPDPSDPAVTCRVLTILLASEY